MKHQYVGDVNDYRKYGLLRALQAEGDEVLLVAWMLTDDDGSSDGGMRDYLGQPERWRHHDPQLYDGLAAMLRSASRPSVSLVERSNLMPRARYFAELVPDDRPGREAWGERLLAAAAGASLVFLDPDNGIEVPSRPVGRKGSSKYVTWSEIERLWALGCSLLIYQHFGREARSEFTARLTRELQQRTGAPFVTAFRTPHVLFLLAAQERHEVPFQTAIFCRLRGWSGQLGVYKA